MIQLRSVLIPADNTGAKRLYVIGIKPGSKRKFGYLADIVNCVVNKAEPNGVVKDGEKVLAVVVRTKKETRRTDGSYIRFDDNAAVVIDKDKNPRGTRIFGPIAKEVKDKGFNRIASMAQEVV